MWKDQAQRAIERRFVEWYARHFGGTERGRFDVAERLAGYAYPKYWFSEFDRIWLDDDAFLRWYEREEPANRHSADRKFTLRSLAALVAHLPGDVVEFGAYRGASAELMGRALPKRLLHLFDSFEGLSAPTSRDGDYWRAGDLSAQEQEVRGRLEAARIPYRLYPGWIPERFRDVPERTRFVLAHIDVDLYQPTLDSIAFAYPRLVSGALIVLDDYGSGSCPGARSAVDEFMVDKPEPVVLLTTGQALIQKR